MSNKPGRPTIYNRSFRQLSKEVGGVSYETIRKYLRKDYEHMYYYTVKKLDKYFMENKIKKNENLLISS